MLLRPLERGTGQRLFTGGRWFGTVWHSNIWGWQWARVAGEHGPSFGGQCQTLESGLAILEGLAV